MQDAVMVGGAMVVAGVFLVLFTYGVFRSGTDESDAYAAWLQRRRRIYRIVGVILVVWGVVVFLRESGLLAEWLVSA